MKICHRCRAHRSHLRQRLARMAPHHHREIDQEQPARDLEHAVEPGELGEQRLQAVERRRRPRRPRPASWRRPHQPAAPAGDARRSAPPGRWRVRDSRRPADGRPPAPAGRRGRDTRAPRRRGSWRRCRCGRHRPGRAPPIRLMKVSTLSELPVTSKTNELVLASITLARNTSARRSASTRFSPVLLTLISASSRSMCGPSIVRSCTLCTGTSRSSCALICSITIGVPAVTMVMRERFSARVGLGDGEALDVVAAAGEQADHAGEDARLVVDQHRDGVARRPARDLLTPAPCLLRTPAWRRGRPGPAACRNGPRPTGSSGSSSPPCRRRRRR